MSGEPGTVIPECAECDARWVPADGRRWRAYVTIDDEVGVYCPECAEREFGEVQGPSTESGSGS